MTIRLDINTNAPQLAQAFAELAAEQIPFATAVALTRVAVDSRDVERKNLGRTFTLRSRKRVEGGIQINRAEKSAWPNCAAEVGLKDEFMARHVVGGEKTPPPGGKHVAIPTKIMPRSPSGIVLARHKPGPIIRRPGGFVAGPQGGRFEDGKKTPAGDGLVRERVDARLENRQKVEGFGKATRQLSKLSNLDVATWYLLRDKVKIDATWDFDDGVAGTVGDRYPVHFKTEFEAAIRSARARLGKFSSEAGRFFYLKARRPLGAPI